MPLKMHRMANYKRSKVFYGTKQNTKLKRITTQCNAEHSKSSETLIDTVADGIEGMIALIHEITEWQIAVYYRTK